MDKEYPQHEELAPEVYTKEQLSCIDRHIHNYFGQYETVFHEKISPDIHVDICISVPTEEHNYYTLTTMGMGAHLMNVSASLKDYRLERAELLIKLPPDWEIDNKKDERWYWPFRWLKIMARLPVEHNTWLGQGHTVPKSEPFADNTNLCAMLLDLPYTYGDESMTCTLPDGQLVHFYQMIPLYEEELKFKKERGYDALIEYLGDDFSDIVDIDRPNYCEGVSDIPNKVNEKKWAIRKEDMRDLIVWDEAAACFATDRILVDGLQVGYMYREEPEADSDMPDSGWRFMAGDETDEYMDNADNSGIYHLNTICNYDPEIIPLLNAAYGTAYERDEQGAFRQCEEEQQEN